MAGSIATPAIPLRRKLERPAKGALGILLFLLGGALLVVTPYRRTREEAIAPVRSEEGETVSVRIAIPVETQTTHRHWLRGIVGGVLFGVGLAVVVGLAVALAVAKGPVVVVGPAIGKPPPPHSSTLTLQEPKTDTTSR